MSRTSLHRRLERLEQRLDKDDPNDLDSLRGAEIDQLYWNLLTVEAVERWQAGNFEQDFEEIERQVLAEILAENPL